jgi:hypothetical protein
MWCATGTNFKIFAADSKMFENFPTYSIFLKKIPADSKILAENLPIAHHICIPVVHWAVRYV